MSEDPTRCLALRIAMAHEITGGRVSFLPDYAKEGNALAQFEAALQALVAEILGGLAAKAEELALESAALKAQVEAIVPVGDLAGVEGWTAERAYLQERIAALEAALAPFATLADGWDGGDGWTPPASAQFWSVWMEPSLHMAGKPTLGDCRRARGLLRKE